VLPTAIVVEIVVSVITGTHGEEPVAFALSIAAEYLYMDIYKSTTRLRVKCIVNCRVTELDRCKRH